MVYLNSKKHHKYKSLVYFFFCFAITCTLFLLKAIYSKCQTTDFKQKLYSRMNNENSIGQTIWCHLLFLPCCNWAKSKERCRLFPASTEPLPSLQLPSCPNGARAMGTAMLCLRVVIFEHCGWKM